MYKWVGGIANDVALLEEKLLTPWSGRWNESRCDFLQGVGKVSVREACVVFGCLEWGCLV